MHVLAIATVLCIGAIEIDDQGRPVPPPPPLWRTVQDAIPPAIFYFVGGGILMGAAAMYLKHGNATCSNYMQRGRDC